MISENDLQILSQLSSSISTTTSELNNNPMVDILIQDLGSGSTINSFRTKFTEYSKYFKIEDSDENGYLDLNSLSEEIVKDRGLSTGDYDISYKFYTNILGNDDTKLFIKKISPSRKEILIKFVKDNNTNKSEIDTFCKQYFNRFTKDFTIDKYIYFGLSSEFLIVNAVSQNDSIILKLYEPLPSNIRNNDSFIIIQKIIDDVKDIIQYVAPYIQDLSGIIKLGQPNFNLSYDNISIEKSKYMSYDSIINTSSSLYDFAKKNYGADSLDKFEGVNLNLDYSDFKNFVHFGSARKLLENFRLKLYNIENQQTLIGNSSGSVNSIEMAKNKIQNIINSFDGFEKYLYFESSSYAWPKTNSSKPYILSTINSVEAITWFDNIYSTAVTYDETNRDYLFYTIPYKIRNDDSNKFYVTFIDMIGQVFDYIYSYIKKMTFINIRENEIGKGAPKELLWNIAKNFGLNLTNGNNLVEYLLYKYGIDSASVEQIKEDITYEIWNRLVNNLPFILKSKGTLRSIKSLLNCYGIPSKLMKIKQFNGVNSSDNNSEFQLDEFTYLLNFKGNQKISIPWILTNKNRKPDSIEFKFKTDYAQNSKLVESSGFSINLNSVKDDLGYISFRLSGLSGSLECTSSTLPIFNNELYSVLLNRNVKTDTDHQYDLFLKKYDPLLGKIVYESSASLEVQNNQIGFNNYYNNVTQIYLGGNSTLFKGQLDEFRLWNTPLFESTFNGHVKFGSSINGNELTSSLDDLIFRLSFNNPFNIFETNILKNDVYNSSYASEVVTVGFENISDYPYQFVEYDRVNTVTSRFIESNTFNTQNIIIDQNTLNTISKDTLILNHLDSSLSNQTSKFTGNITDKIIIGFSPSDLINEEFLRLFGDSNITDVYGDSKYIYLDSYSSENTISNLFWNSTKLSYSTSDYVKFIKSFDNSLFEQMNELIPAKSTVSMGLIYEESMLKRNKIKLINKPQFNVNLIRVPKIDNNLMIFSSKNEIYIGRVGFEYKKIDSKMSNNKFSTEFKIKNPISNFTESVKTSFIIGKNVTSDVNEMCQSSINDKFKTNLYGEENSISAKVELYNNKNIISQTKINKVSYNFKYDKSVRSFLNDEDSAIDNKKVVDVWKTNSNKLKVSPKDSPRLDIES
jgi:hypothetical protein